jgi:hypothetical protein
MSTTKGRFGPGDRSHVFSHSYQAWQLLNATQPCDDCLVIKQTKAIRDENTTIVNGVGKNEKGLEGESASTANRFAHDIRLHSAS